MSYLKKGLRARHASGGSGGRGGVKKEARAIGVRNNDGRAEVAAEAVVEKIRKKARDWGAATAYARGRIEG